MMAHYFAQDLRPQGYWALTTARRRPLGAGDWPIVDIPGRGWQKLCRQYEPIKWPLSRRQGLTTDLLARYEIAPALDLAR